ncbi:MAG: (Fe-S)-binding protein [Thiotrichales bacterium]
MNTSAERPREVYFFGTCLIDVLFPQAGLAAMKLLRRAGVRVIFPQGQTCCGQPPFNSGYRDEARAVARRQLDLFARDIPVVVPSGSCAGMLKHHYRELFANEPEEAKAAAFSARVFEFTEFLVDGLAIELRDLGPPTSIAIHTSCSARREMGVADRIERLVDQLAQVEKREQAYKAECCGFGGTFAVKQAEISAAMVADKTDHIAATEAEFLLGQDCGCLMNIGGAFEKQGRGPKVLHIAEFLWHRTGGDR